MLEPFKFIVQPVFLERGDGDAIVGEQGAEPVALYGVDAVRAWLDAFDDQVAALNTRELARSGSTSNGDGA